MSIDQPEDDGFDVHPDILKLGLVSFLTDFSSEMIFSVFAVFFTTIAGASAALLGVVEGLADLSASSLNYTAGWLSDRTGKHKVFALSGYGFSMAAKAILLVSSTVTSLGFFRVVERLGKSFRGAPRDAWISEIANRNIRGYSFGVHKALDKSGAVLGPLVAYGLLSWLGDGIAAFRILFWVAFIPAVLGVIALCLMEDQPQVPGQRVKLLETWRALSPQFKRYLLTSGIFSLAYFSFSFLMLRAQGMGFTVRDIVLLYALFNMAFVVAAPLMGRVGDRVGRASMIMLGYLVYLVMSLGFAFANKQWHIVALFITYGVFYAVDEAQSKAFIADLELERRASAIGLYNFVTGLLYLPASLIAGMLWLRHPSSAFFVASCLAFGALITFLWLRPDK